MEVDPLVGARLAFPRLPRGLQRKKTPMSNTTKSLVAEKAGLVRKP